MHEDRFTKQKCWHVHQEPLQQKKREFILEWSWQPVLSIFISKYIELY